MGVVRFMNPEKPYTNKTQQYSDEVMSLEYTNGKWDELNKTILVFDLFMKDKVWGEVDPEIKKFYRAMINRRDYLSKLMAKMTYEV